MIFGIIVGEIMNCVLFVIVFWVFFKVWIVFVFIIKFFEAVSCLMVGKVSWFWKVILINGNLFFIKIDFICGK